MLTYNRVALLLALLVTLSWTTSAFSTRFIIEGVQEEGKEQTTEGIRTQKVEEKNVTENITNQDGVEVEFIPIVTDVFTQTEELANMTPLKLATAIAAQYLLTAVQNIPVAGNSYQDNMDMLEGIVSEFNKTAQIINLAAEYVNISGHYILSTLKQFRDNNCDVTSIAETMKSIRMNFLKTVTDHIVGAVKDLNEKTKKRKMTGSDILVSSAYHIVTAFQEMTNQVLTVTNEENKKCKSPPPSIEVTSATEEKSNILQKKGNDLYSFQVVPQQGKMHKSIKKDQATPIGQNFSPGVDFKNYDNPSLNNNQDLTIEFFAPETLLNTHKPEIQSSINNNNNLEVSRFVNPPKDKLRPNDVENLPITNKPTFFKNIDRELDSSMVDSLSNVPWGSNEPEVKDLVGKMSVDERKQPPHPQKFLNILEFLGPKNIIKPNFKPCDGSVEPVCGIDTNNKNFIIFLNDCKRKEHNRVYGTNYTWFTMDTCVNLFMQNPTASKENGEKFPKQFRLPTKINWSFHD